VAFKFLAGPYFRCLPWYGGVGTSASASSATPTSSAAVSTASTAASIGFSTHVEWNPRILFSWNLNDPLFLARRKVPGTLARAPLTKFLARTNFSARTNFPLERYTSIVYFPSSSCLRTRFPCSTEVADEVSWFLVVASTILRCYDDSYAYKTESVLEESARSSYETRIRPLTYVSVDRAPIRPNRLERNFSLVNLICLFVALRFMSEKHVGKSPPPGRSASTSRSRSS